MFLVILDAVQPLPSSHSSATWQHRPSHTPTSCGQKPISPALVRGPQHPSAPALWSCIWAEAADVAAGPALLGSVLCSTPSPWQSTRMLLTARSLALCCTTAAVESHVLGQPALVQGCPIPAGKPCVCPLRPGTSCTGAQSALFSGLARGCSILTCSSTLILLKRLWKSSTNPRRNSQNIQKSSKQSPETAAQTAVPVGCL